MLLLVVRLVVTMRRGSLFGLQIPSGCCEPSSGHFLLFSLLRTSAKMLH